MAGDRGDATMTTLAAADPLAPVKEALIQRSLESAVGLRRAASGEAARVHAGAEAEARAILDAARAAGTAAGEAIAAAETARARRKAREIVLAARRDAYEELRRRIGAAVADLCEEPGFAGRLARLALDRAGPDAAVEPVPGGGVVAQAQGVRVEMSAEVLTDWALGALGEEVNWLWGP
jgi:hypothetical protein